MKKEFIWLFASVTIIIFLVNLLIYHESSNWSIAYKTLTSSITICWLIWFLFKRFLWKLSFFGWFHQIPNMAGEWEGNVMPINDQMIDVNVRITQEFDFVKIIMVSDSMISESVNFHLNFNSKNQTSDVIYTYRTEPKVTQLKINPSHWGTVKLSYIVDQGSTLLRGTYWTNRKTVGDILLIKRK